MNLNNEFLMKERLWLVKMLLKQKNKKWLESLLYWNTFILFASSIFFKKNCNSLHSFNNQYHVCTLQAS